MLKSLTLHDGTAPCAGPGVGRRYPLGTTYSGGNSLGGTVFKVNTDGTDFSVIKHCHSEQWVPSLRGPDAVG